MNYSYWEKNVWFSNIDFTVIGSGIVGLNCALYIKEHHPNAKVLILEKGHLPQGASTKNAGFACFGSLSELLDDLKHHSENDVCQLVQKRWEGLQLLRKNLGDKTIGFQQLGGYELFTDDALYANCLSQRENINQLLSPLFKSEVFSETDNVFRFENTNHTLIYNAFEGQINTGKLMKALLKKAYQNDIHILNNCEVIAFEENSKNVAITTHIKSFTTSKLCVATNGFAAQLLQEAVTPARAQVLITKPIENLHIKGTFHLDKGYYYFRNIDDRILFGGGRHLDFKTEETTQFGETEIVQNKLEHLLKTTILPHTPFEIDYSWSGIMGIGTQKKVLLKPISNRVFCGVRLGGMGIAIGTHVGKSLAELATA